MNINNKFLKITILILGINFINVKTITSAASLDELDEPNIKGRKGPIEEYEEDVSTELNKRFPVGVGNIISQYHKINPTDDDSLEEAAAIHLKVNYPLYVPGTHNLFQPLEILGLAPGRKHNPSDIRTARRKQLLLFHPDKNPKISPEAYTRISQIINEAFDQASR